MSRDAVGQILGVELCLVLTTFCHLSAPVRAGLGGRRGEGGSRPKAKNAVGGPREDVVLGSTEEALAFAFRL